MHSCRVAVILAGLLVLAGCGGGPVYRGAPPEGVSDAQYRCSLAGDCPIRGSKLAQDGTKDVSAADAGKF